MSTGASDKGASQSHHGSDLHFYDMLANIDRMWRKLPEHVVEDLNMQILMLTHTELKKYTPVPVIIFEQND